MHIFNNPFSVLADFRRQNIMAMTADFVVTALKELKMYIVRRPVT